MKKETIQCSIFFTLLVFTIACNRTPQPANENKDTSLAQSSIAPPEKKDTVLPLRNQPVLGIDVSHFQKDVNWDEIRQAGIRYAYSKATQGVTDIDPKFKRNHVDARAAGLFHGAYHFYVAGDDPSKQAELFLKQVKPLTDKSVPPVLDLEQGGMKEGINIAVFQKDVLTWLTKVEASLGVRPIIYTNYPFGNQYLNHNDFSKYHLWIAEYGVHAPRIPNAWKDKGWLMWQRTERGKIEGAIGNVDHDLFNGTAQLLDQLAVGN